MFSNSGERMSEADETSGACSGKEVILSGRFKTVRARTVVPNKNNLTNLKLTLFRLQTHVLS